MVKRFAFFHPKISAKIIYFADVCVCFYPNTKHSIGERKIRFGKNVSRRGWMDAIKHIEDVWLVISTEKLTNIHNDLSLFSNVSTIKWVLRLNKKRDLKMNERRVGQRGNRPLGIVEWMCRTRWKTMHAEYRQIKGATREWKKKTKLKIYLWHIWNCQVEVKSWVISNTVCICTQHKQQCETGQTRWNDACVYETNWRCHTMKPTKAKNTCSNGI